MKPAQHTIEPIAHLFKGMLHRIVGRARCLVNSRAKDSNARRLADKTQRFTIGVHPIVLARLECLRLGTPMR
jgi:hypothetical protein